jgi:DNA helicase HerA-like ATPase
MVSGRVFRIRRKRYFCVKGYSKKFYEVLQLYYDVLRSHDARYVYLCKKGTCYSYIEADASVPRALLEAPGLEIEEVHDIKRCNSGLLLLPEPGREAFLRTNYIDKRKKGGQCIRLGRAGNKSACIDIGDIMRHVLIVGSTGSGKTHTAARLAYCLNSYDDATAVILDWHGEYKHILSKPANSNARINIVEYSYPNLPKLPLISDIFPLEVSIEILERILNLSTYQSSLLGAILLTIYQKAINASDLKKAESTIGSRLVETISKMIRARSDLGLDLYYLYELLLRLYEEFVQDYSVSRAEREIWAALIRRIQSLIASGFHELFIIYGKPPISSIHDKNVVIYNLGSIHSAKIRRLYAYYLLYTLFFYKISKKDGKNNVAVVVEEAHNLLDLDIVPLILQEARKYGLGLIVVTHSPSQLPLAAQSNLNTLIIHRLVGENDINFIKTITDLREFHEIVTKLKPSEALLITDQAKEIITVSLGNSC